MSTRKRSREEMVAPEDASEQRLHADLSECNATVTRLQNQLQSARAEQARIKRTIREGGYRDLAEAGLRVLKCGDLVHFYVVHDESDVGRFAEAIKHHPEQIPWVKQHGGVCRILDPRTARNNLSLTAWANKEVQWWQRFRGTDNVRDASYLL